MLVTRFCSQKEYQEFVDGKLLVNTTDHQAEGQASTSTGFCFTIDSPREAWRHLKGIIPPPDICMVLEIPGALLKPTRARYADHSYSPPRPYYKVEFCATKYSNHTAKLIKVLHPHEFSTPDEMAAAKLIYNMMNRNKEKK